MIIDALKGKLKKEKISFHNVVSHWFYRYSCNL